MCVKSFDGDRVFTYDRSMIIEAINSKTLLKVYVQPGAKKTEIKGLYGEPVRLKIKLHARPVEGEANSELIRFLASTLEISPGKIEIFRGHLSRNKDLIIDSLSDEIMRKLKQYL